MSHKAQLEHRLVLCLCIMKNEYKVKGSSEEHMRCVLSHRQLFITTLPPFMPPLHQYDLWSRKTQPQAGSNTQPVNSSRGEITEQALSLGFPFLLLHFLWGCLKMCLLHLDFLDMMLELDEVLELLLPCLHQASQSVCDCAEISSALCKCLTPGVGSLWSQKEYREETLQLLFSSFCFYYSGGRGVILSTEGFLPLKCWKGMYKIEKAEISRHEQWTRLSGHWVPLLFHSKWAAQSGREQKVYWLHCMSLREARLPEYKCCVVRLAEIKAEGQWSALTVNKKGRFSKRDPSCKTWEFRFSGHTAFKRRLLQPPWFSGAPN